MIVGSEGGCGKNMKKWREAGGWKQGSSEDGVRRKRRGEEEDVVRREDEGRRQVERVRRTLVQRKGEKGV